MKLLYCFLILMFSIVFGCNNKAETINGNTETSFLISTEEVGLKLNWETKLQYQRLLMIVIYHYMFKENTFDGTYHIPEKARKFLHGKNAQEVIEIGNSLQNEVESKIDEYLSRQNND